MDANDVTAQRVGVASTSEVGNEGEGETGEETGGRKGGSGRLVEGCGADVFAAACQAASPE